MLKILFLFFSLLLVYSNFQAQTVIGKYAGEFMAIGVGGRSSGMGSAATAIANDVTAGYWNPAGLSRISYPQFALMHEEHFGSLVNYNYAAAALPYGKDMTFAISMIRLGIDGIPNVPLSAGIDSNGDGLVDQIDKTQISEFNSSDWAFYLSFAKQLSDEFQYGVNAKVIIRDLSEYSAYGIGFDIGAMYKPYEKLFLGANLMDITTTLVAWSTGRNELITPTAKFGAAYALDFSFGRFLPAADVDIRFENRRYASQFNIGPVSFDSHFGLEYSYKSLFAVRAGYNDVKQFTVGAGVKLPKLTIDYSFARFNMSKEERLDDSHRISLILTLEEPRFAR